MAAGETQRTRPDFTPAQVLVRGFALLIGLGTAVLMLPAASATGKSIGFLDALFTATSAVCVTGLTVLRTSADFSPFGQLVILLLIQMGGLGIMTMSTFVALLLGRKITLKERLVLQEAMGRFSIAGLVRLIRLVLFVTFVIEGIGAVLLAARLAADYPLGRAIWLGIFHSVSAFNNAGFDLFGPSLRGFTQDVPVNLVVSSLFIIGGLGFSVLADLYNWRYARSRLSLHTRLVLKVSGALVLFGTGAVLLLEYSNPGTLGPLPLSAKLMAAFFQAVTPRTAGFSTLDTGRLGSPTLLLIMVLMFIGASPGGTGGGTKTTTFGAVLASVWTTISGKGEIEIGERRLSRDVVDKALAISMISLGVILLATVLLLLTEGAELVPVLFEATSAFGTVGLTTGITPGLSPAGKLIVILTMFTGRVGPLTMAVAIAHRQRHPGTVKFPEERISVG